MSTKINTEYYGAENAFVDLARTYVKRSPYNIGNLFTNGNYTGGALDMSAAPWGIGKSSASSDFQYIAQKGATWTIEKLTRKKGNTPLFIYVNSSSYTGALSNADFVGLDVSSDNYEKALYKCRISPDAEDDGGTLKSTLSIDSGDNVNIANALSNFPITYLNYQHVRLYINHVYYKPVNSPTIEKCTMNDIEANRVDVDYIVYFDCYLSYDSATADTPNETGAHCSIGGNAVDIPEIFKGVYYDDKEQYVRPWRYIERFGYWYIDTNWYSSDDFRDTLSDYINYKSAWETLGNSDFVYANPINCGWSHLSDVQQDFDGLKYHWNSGLSPYNANPWVISEIKTGDIYTSGTYRSYAYLEVDEIPDGMTKNEAYFNAVLHECAFLGFPIVLNHISVYHSFGESDVYLPVFDEHQITTGDFKNGAESLSLPNAQWGDIFGATMPKYDPEYDPTPQPEPGEDGGDITNTTISRYSNAGGLKQYVLSESKLIELTAFLNGTYLPTSADLDADFKGTNPQDYVVSVQKYPFDLRYESGDPYIYVGKINTGITAKSLFPSFGGSVLPINSRCTFDFGTIYIDPNNSNYCYGDFRDFQSKLLLFMPFVGTAELDPRLYIAHTVGLIYTIDYNTGSVAAEIKRDGLTMETKTSTISITIPFMAANMGAYQNQLAQLDYSKQMTKIKGIQTAVSTAFQIGSAAQGAAATGNVPGLGQLSAIAK